jgi:hypothetical protein
VFLERLLKATEREHPDYPLLQKALEEFSDAAQFIEEGQKRRLNQARMAGVRARLIEAPHDLGKPGRVYLRSGVLCKLGRFADRYYCYYCICYVVYIVCSRASMLVVLVLADMLVHEVGQLDTVFMLIDTHCMPWRVVV